MLILLPPSETKRPGGTGRPLDTDALALPSLAPERERVVDALVALSDDPAAARRVLKLSDRQAHQVDVNRGVRTSPTLPAIDRYTGVLFDALDAASLDGRARAWVREHVLIHSAPFGPVGALDPIPDYRLAAGTTLPDLPPMRRVWAAPVTAALTAAASGPVLDLRSEAYAALGPVPEGTDSAYLRVVSEGADGAVRALNHFNKQAKGELVRLLATTRPRVRTVDGFVRWATGAGLRVRRGAPGEVELFAKSRPTPLP